MLHAFDASDRPGDLGVRAEPGISGACPSSPRRAIASFLCRRHAGGGRCRLRLYRPATRRHSRIGRRFWSAVCATAAEGYYALDVTDPNVVDETGAAGKVLWEFPNAATSAAVVEQSRLQLRQAAHREDARVRLGGAGYLGLQQHDAATAKGHLFVLNASTGAVLADLVTPDGTSANQANLGQISGFVANGQQDLTVEQVYGGDNLGNVWRFDLSSSQCRELDRGQARHAHRHDRQCRSRSPPRRSCR